MLRCTGGFFYLNKSDFREFYDRCHLCSSALYVAFLPEKDQLEREGERESSQSFKNNSISGKI